MTNSKTLSDDSTLKHLDIGCFQGMLLDQSKQAGWDTYGVELQSEAAQIAKNKHGEDRIICGPFNELTFPHVKFDIITAIDVLEHLQEPVKLIQYAYNSLEGGVLILVTPDTGSLIARLMGRKWFAYAAPEHIFYFNRKCIKNLLSENGFSDIKISYNIKRLKISYVLYQLQFFGKEIYRKYGKILGKMPSFIQNIELPFYGGEMFVIAKK